MTNKLCAELEALIEQWRRNALRQRVFAIATRGSVDYRIHEHYEYLYKSHADELAAVLSRHGEGEVMSHQSQCPKCGSGFICSNLSEIAETAAERDRLIREIQRYQPAGSPPPGDSSLLAAWVLSSIAKERDRLREELADLAADELDRIKLTEAVRLDVKKALRDALGKKICNYLWGPELEALGSVAYEVYEQKVKAEQERDRLKEANAELEEALDEAYRTLVSVWPAIEPEFMSYYSEIPKVIKQAKAALAKHEGTVKP